MELYLGGNPKRSLHGIPRNKLYLFATVMFDAMTLEHPVYLSNMGKKLVQSSFSNTLDTVSDKNFFSNMRDMRKWEITEGDDDCYYVETFWHSRKGLDDLYQYYRWAPLDLAKKFLKDPGSLTVSEIIRLAWEGDKEELALLEENLTRHHNIIQSIKNHLESTVHRLFPEGLPPEIQKLVKKEELEYNMRLYKSQSGLVEIYREGINNQSLLGFFDTEKNVFYDPMMVQIGYIKGNWINIWQEKKGKRLFRIEKEGGIIFSSEELGNKILGYIRENSIRELKLAADIKNIDLDEIKISLDKFNYGEVAQLFKENHEILRMPEGKYNQERLILVGEIDNFNDIHWLAMAALFYRWGKPLFSDKIEYHFPALRITELGLSFDGKNHIARLIGRLNDRNYLRVHNVTKELLEKVLDDVIEYIEKKDGSAEGIEDDYVSFQRELYQILGYFVLVTGAEIPASVKEKILIASDFQYEQSLWPTPLKEERKFFLDELHENLKRHEPGRVVHLTPEY